jgi:hypothetical protein
MWQRISKPDALVYLDLSLDVLHERKPGHQWTEAILSEQKRRLTHALRACDLYLHTDRLSQEQVLQQAIRFLSELSS